MNFGLIFRENNCAFLKLFCIPFSYRFTGEMFKVKGHTKRKENALRHLASQHRAREIIS